MSQKVWITGASGLVGRSLMSSFARLRPDDCTLLTPTSKELDLRSRDSVDSYISTNRPDVIVHAAGVVGGIAANMAKPVDFLLDNMVMGMNVIGSAAQRRVPALVNLGSSCMYPKDHTEPLREEDVLTGRLEPTNEGYAIAKIAADRLCEYVSRQDGLAFRTVIPSNLYGPFDHFEPERGHMLASAIRKVHFAKVRGREQVEIWGDGSARREFTYAGDVSDWIAENLLTVPKWPQRLNLGVGVDYTINEFYAIAAAAVGFRGAFVHDVSKPTGMRRKLMDSSLAAEHGWRPATGVELGVQKTYEYFLDAGVPV